MLCFTLICEFCICFLFSKMVCIGVFCVCCFAQSVKTCANMCIFEHSVQIFPMSLLTGFLGGLQFLSPTQNMQCLLKLAKQLLAKPSHHQEVSLYVTNRVCQTAKCSSEGRVECKGQICQRSYKFIHIIVYVDR